MQAPARVTQHGRGARGALLRDAPQHARGAQLLVLAHAGVDALGRERDVHVLADAQATRGQGRRQQLAGGAHVRGRGQHERLPGARVAHDRGARVAQDAGVRLQLLVHRGRHADQHEVGRVERADAVGEHEPVAGQVAAQVALLALQQLSRALADRGEAGAGNVDPDDPAAGVAQCDRGGQADVAEADDRDDGVAGPPGAVWRGAAAGRLRRSLYRDGLWHGVVSPEGRPGGGDVRCRPRPSASREQLVSWCRSGSAGLGRRTWPCRMAAWPGSCTTLGRLVERCPKEPYTLVVSKGRQGVRSRPQGTAGSIEGVRDYLRAIHNHVVVYDGGMGATLEQSSTSPPRTTAACRASATRRSCCTART